MVEPNPTERISVVMPMYNGERYIAEQIASILAQTVAVHEIIVTDDTSTDNSVEIVRAIADERIKLVQNSDNLGLVRNVSKAISLSSGDIVFLADQDDVWKADKVEKLLACLNGADGASLAISDCSITDSNLNIIGESYFSEHLGSLSPANQFLFFRVLGSSMCARRELLDFAQPFLQTTQLNHDVVIFFCAVMKFGRTPALNDALYLYRRHDATHSTAAGGRRNSLWSVLQRRIRLLALVSRIFLADPSRKG